MRHQTPASSTGNLRSPVDIQGTSPPSTRNGLLQGEPEGESCRRVGVHLRRAQHSSDGPSSRPRQAVQSTTNAFTAPSRVTPVSVIRSQKIGKTEAKSSGVDQEVENANSAFSSQQQEPELPQ